MTETTTDSGLRYTDITIGDGETATGKGQTAIVHYTGWLEDGTKFDVLIGRFFASLKFEHREKLDQLGLEPGYFEFK